MDELKERPWYQLTDWYPINVKPVREGWYQIKVNADWLMVYWSGKTWNYEFTKGCLTRFYFSPMNKWRGLTRKYTDG